MAEKTIFERVIAGELPHHPIHQDSLSAAFLDAFPNHPGHTLVVPRAPYRDIFALPDDVAAHLFLLVRDVATAVREACGAEGVNVVMNNGAAAGQEVFHAHVHVIPRFKDDGGYLGRHVKYESPEAAAALAGKIREALAKVRG